MPYADEVDMTNLLFGDSSSPTDDLTNQIFETWWVTRRHRIYAYALRYVKGDTDAAEDITQNVALKVLLNLRQWRGEHFDAWVRRITQNEALQYLKVQTREQAFSSLEDIEDTLQDKEDDPLNTLLKNERREYIHQSVAALPIGSKAALTLDLEDLALRQIADILGLPLSTVKSRLSYGRNVLRHHADFEDYICRFFGSAEQTLSLLARVWWKTGTPDPLGALLALRAMIAECKAVEHNTMALMYMGFLPFGLR